MNEIEDNNLENLPIFESDHLESHEIMPSKLFVDKMSGQVKMMCTRDGDCKERYHICGIKEAGVCDHKDVFPTEKVEIIGVLVFAFIMGLCTVAGIGGGGIAISLIIAFFNFTTKPAVAISSFSILLCTMMRFLYNFKTMHPEKPNVVLLDYSLATIMMPTTLAGSQLGSIILKAFPSLYIQVALTLLLSLLSYQSYKKASELHTKE
jgi:hypothetical protein